MKTRNVLITGGSRGIGKAIIKQLKSEGYKIINPNSRELDLSDNASVKSFIKKNKSLRIDILINNAGINNPQWINELEDKNLEQTLKINLISPIKLIKAFVPNMIKGKWGRIINISSIFGVVARGKQVPYVASKHALNGVTKTLALELGKNNILVNSICPGFTNTDLIKKNPPEKIAELVKDIPLGRLAEPEEIANLVSFLVSPKNSYITGSIIVIDGGFTCK